MARARPTPPTPRAPPLSRPPLGSLLLPPSPDASLPAWARTIGVTRVARVTGLDRCGVEVACAIRPAGQLLQVSNGKGRTFDEAKVSALSEALELWCSERLDGTRVRLLREDLSGEFWPGEFLGGLPDVSRDRSAVVPWVEGERLDRKGRAFIPASHVACPPVGGGNVGLRTIGFTLNGVGAHPDRTRAQWHGLLELLEREALCRTLPDGWMPEHLESRSLRFQHELLPFLATQGITAHVVDATPKHWPIPVVAVLLVDPESRAAPLAAGYACRPTPEAAAEAALYEACQSRLTEIHGAREDVSQDVTGVPEWLAEVRARPKSLDRLPSWKGPVPGLLRDLEVAAASVSIAPEGFPLFVERVFVPGFRCSELLL